MRPKKYAGKKKKTDTNIQKDLGLDSWDEMMITTTGIKGKNFEASTSNSAQSTDNEENERKIHEPFCWRGKSPLRIEAIPTSPPRV